MDYNARFSREMCLGSYINQDFVTFCEAISGDGTESTSTDSDLIRCPSPTAMVFTTTDIPDDTLTALPEPAAQMMTLLWNGLHIPNDLIATQDSSIYVATPLLRGLTAHFCTTNIKVTAEPETTTETTAINPRLRPYTKHIAKYYDRLNESK